MKKIMIVDDDREFLEELKETLFLSDYDVVQVNDATTAIDEAIRTHPDLILLDINMPDESGFQVACALRHFSGLRAIPILAMTGHFKDSYVPLMRTYGIQGYVRKPIDIIEMVTKIERIV